MFSFALFILSGAIIVTLAVAKRVEEKKKRTPFVLRAVSKGDVRVREIHHEALRQYSEAKDKSSFYLRKQLPLKMKSLANKLQVYVKGRGTEYFGDIRGAKLLRKRDGISEFFKSISDIEKGKGKINETLPEDMREDFHVESVPKQVEVSETKVETIITTEIEEKPVHIVTAVEPALVVEVKPKKKRVYKPRVRKLAVVQVTE